jgi:hypothetical protein
MRSSKYPGLLRERFLAKVDRTGEHWLWRGATRFGASCRGTKLRPFGAMKVHGRVMAAHRIAWELFRYELPADASVRRVCTEQLCVNPEHLDAWVLLPVEDARMRDAMLAELKRREEDHG